MPVMAKGPSQLLLSSGVE